MMRPPLPPWAKKWGGGGRAPAPPPGSKAYVINIRGTLSDDGRGYFVTYLFIGNNNEHTRVCHFIEKIETIEPLKGHELLKKLVPL